MYQFLNLRSISLDFVPRKCPKGKETAGYLSQWGDWSMCKSEHCGQRQYQNRIRHCIIGPNARVKKCEEGETIQSKPCPNFCPGSGLLSFFYIQNIFTHFLRGPALLSTLCRKIVNSI